MLIMNTMAFTIDWHSKLVSIIIVDVVVWVSRFNQGINKGMGYISNFG